MTDFFEDISPEINEKVHYLAEAKNELSEMMPAPPTVALMHEIDLAPEGIAPYIIIEHKKDLTMVSVHKPEEIEDIIPKIKEISNTQNENGHYLKVILDPRHENFKNRDDYLAITAFGIKLEETDIPMELIEMDLYQFGYSARHLNYDKPPEFSIKLPEEHQHLPHYAELIAQLIQPKIDAKAMGLDEMLALLQVQYAVHRHEEMHVVYLKEEQVLSYEKVKIGTEDTIVFTKEELPAYFQKLKETADKLGADRVIEVHNHPYGATQPSPADIRTHCYKSDTFANLTDVIAFDSAIIGPYSPAYIFSRYPERIEHLEDIFYW